MCTAKSTSSAADAQIVGFRGTTVPWGVQVGGAEHSLLDKNLNLPPLPGGPGKHLDSRRPKLIDHVSHLHHELLRQVHSRQRLPHALRLPRYWAGFECEIEDKLEGDGPELLAVARQLQLQPTSIFASSRREHRGLVLYPLDWVSHRWQDITQVYVDMTTCPPFQVIWTSDGASPLRGYRGAVSFDLTTSRFRPQSSPA